MRRSRLLITVTLLLYLVTFLYHDIIFHNSHIIGNNSSCTKVEISREEVSHGLPDSRLAITHQCPFCFGFLYGEQFQIVIALIIFTKDVPISFDQSYTFLLIENNPKRAPPLAT